MKLSIIIPAYNEEDGIAEIINRTLSVRDIIIQSTPVDDIEIIVVDDGSKDRTAEIARRYNDIILISYLDNHGYGAAIKKGFDKARGDLLAFLDADGTCDPAFFRQLINTLCKDDADIAIASRLGPQSKMPKIRILGNKIFAFIIGFFGNARISDCASGMRVLKRNSLIKLYPLPDGLDFTPAMSCKAILSKELKIVEIPFEYKERIGISKLNIINDGKRFLKVILEMILFYRPLKLFLSVGIILMAISVFYSMSPILFYIFHRRIEEYFIYRLISIIVCFMAGLNSIIVGFLSNEISTLINNRESFIDRIKIRMVENLFSPATFLIVGLLCASLGVLLNVKTIKEYIFTGKISVHWVYPLVGGFLVLFGIQIFTYGFLHKIIVLCKKNRISLNYIKNGCKY